MLAVAVNVCALTVICAGETIFYLPEASHLPLAKRACSGRILLAERQGLSLVPPTAAQLLRRLRVAPKVLHMTGSGSRPQTIPCDNLHDSFTPSTALAAGN